MVHFALAFLHLFLADCSGDTTGTCTKFSNGFVGPMFTMAQILIPVAAAIHGISKLTSGHGDGMRSLMIEIGLVGGGAVLALQVVKTLAGL